ncbi:MAG TPA: ATP-binding protein [Oligoflexus sp.]|uniref:ATP-binding protein n=1 Tax=Oligoflexus sp. TaxID=1971216 RepID=UPI002D3386C7|nr:ATP-binding protein [Oligoflexus sp.]HYX31526.1 ATP-binding protein [Oligoflexus sp.]
MKHCALLKGRIVWLLSFMLLGASICSPVFAQSSAPASLRLDKNHLMSIRMGLEDDLNALLAWARDELRRTDPQKEPDAWIRLKYAEAAVLLSKENLADPVAFVQEPMQLALQRGLKEEHLLLMEISKGVSWDAGDEDQKYAELATAARHHNLQHLEARYLALQGYVLMSKGDYDKGLQPMMTSMNIMQKAEGIDELDRMSIRSALAQAFASGSDLARAMDMDRDIVAYARRKNLRGMLATSLHNIAGYYEEQGAEQLKEAQTYYTEALKIGRSLGGHYTVGPSLIGLSAIARRQNKFQEAIQYAREAVQTFKDPVSYWKAEAWLMAAGAQIASKKYEDSLQSLDAAERSAPPELARLFVKIHQQRAEAYEKSNRPVQALAALKAYVAATKDIKQNEAQASYSKGLAELGIEQEQEKNELLLKENELQSQKLKSAERIQNLTLSVLTLALGALVLLMIVVMKAREVRRRKFKMQRILDNIDEGILTINAQLQIEGEYSQHLLQFLGIDAIPKGADAMDTILQHARIEGEQRGMIKEILRNTLGESALAWELNEANLPKELLFEGEQVRTAALHWVPIFDHHGILKRVLLSLRDQTERVKLQAEIQRHMLLLDRKELEVTELFNKDPAQCHAVLDSSSKWIQNRIWQQDSDQKKQALRQLHTLKGNARASGLWQLSHAIHRLEDELQNASTDVAILPGETHLNDLIAEYRHLLNDILHLAPEPHSQLRSLLDAVRPLLPDLNQRLEQGGFKLESINVHDAIIHWDPALFQSATDMIMHALNNSIDHGFLRSHRHSQPTRDVQLIIKAYQTDGSLCLEILDNGAGLDLQKISRRAQQLNLTPPKDDPYQVLFEDGFSTANDVSESSGRGVGLSALAALSRQWNGSVRISPGAGGRGTLVQIHIPLPRAA